MFEFFKLDQVIYIYIYIYIYIFSEICFDLFFSFLNKLEISYNLHKFCTLKIINLNFHNY